MHVHAHDMCMHMSCACAVIKEPRVFCGWLLMLLPPIANEGPCRELSGRNPFAVSTMTRLGVLTGKCFLPFK